MGVFLKSISAAVVSAMLATTITPAFADDGYGYGRGRGGFGNGYGGGRHHDRVDAGDVIAGIAIVGIIAAIASAASKPKQPRYPDRADNRFPQNDDRSAQQSRGSINSENAAVDACAAAAEDRGGQSASVREITTVDANRDGWEVEGVVEQRNGWRDRSAQRKRFTCSVRFGAVETINIDRDSLAFR
ncbi:MAG: hypothetical protein ACKVOJ_12055 [Sphingomonadaceae bacterium]